MYTFIRRCLVLILTVTPVILAGIFSWSFSVIPGKFRGIISISRRLLISNLLQFNIYQSSWYLTLYSMRYSHRRKNQTIWCHNPEDHTLISYNIRCFTLIHHERTPSRVHKRSTFNIIVSNLNLVLKFVPNFWKICFNIIFLYSPRYH
jgi:hypothetical protein